MCMIADWRLEGTSEERRGELTTGNFGSLADGFQSPCDRLDFLLPNLRIEISLEILSLAVEARPCNQNISPATPAPALARAP